MKKIFGVYNARAGFWGELNYLFDKLSNGRHCELCDITHYLIGMKPSWKRFTYNLKIPLILIHINEQNSLMETYTRGKTPCVILGKGNKFEMLLDKSELSYCEGKVERFIERFHVALQKRGFRGEKCI